MRNTYLCLGWCFLGVLGDFHKYFECASRSFYGCFQKDSNVCASCFKGVLGCFCIKKRFTLHTEAMAATHANSNGKKGPKNTPGTPVTYSRITLKHSWNNREVPLKHPWNSLKTPMNHQRNTHVNINMYFPCHNDGHLEEKLLFQCNLASYFVFLIYFLLGQFFWNTL